MRSESDGNEDERPAFGTREPPDDTERLAEGRFEPLCLAAAAQLEQVRGETLPLVPKPGPSPVARSSAGSSVSIGDQVESVRTRGANIPLRQAIATRRAVLGPNDSSSVPSPHAPPSTAIPGLI